MRPAVRPVPCAVRLAFPVPRSSFPCLHDRHQSMTLSQYARFNTDIGIGGRSTLPPAAARDRRPPRRFPAVALAFGSLVSHLHHDVPIIPHAEPSGHHTPMARLPPLRFCGVEREPPFVTEPPPRLPAARTRDHTRCALQALQRQDFFLCPGNPRQSQMSIGLASSLAHLYLGAPNMGPSRIAGVARGVPTQRRRAGACWMAPYRFNTSVQRWKLEISSSQKIFPGRCEYFRVAWPVLTSAPLP